MQRALTAANFKGTAPYWHIFWKGVKDQTMLISSDIGITNQNLGFESVQYGPLKKSQIMDLKFVSQGERCPIFNESFADSRFTLVEDA